MDRHELVIELADQIQLAQSMKRCNNSRTNDHQQAIGRERGAWQMARHLGLWEDLVDLVRKRDEQTEERKRAARAVLAERADDEGRRA